MRCSCIKILKFQVKSRVCNYCLFKREKLVLFKSSCEFESPPDDCFDQVNRGIVSQMQCVNCEYHGGDEEMDL